MAKATAERVRQILRETLKSEPMAEVDYAEVADAETLEHLGDLGESDGPWLCWLPGSGRRG